MSANPTCDEIQYYLGRIVGQICPCLSFIRWLKGREAYLLTWETDRYDLQKHIESAIPSAATDGFPYASFPHITVIARTFGQSPLRMECLRFVTTSCRPLGFYRFRRSRLLPDSIHTLANGTRHPIGLRTRLISIANDRHGWDWLDRNPPHPQACPRGQRIDRVSTQHRITRSQDETIPSTSYQAADIKKNHDAIWELATMNLAGHACKVSA